MSSLVTVADHVRGNAWNYLLAFVRERKFLASIV